MDIGEKVRWQRSILGLSQEKVAKMACCHRTTVMNLERNKRDIRLDTLESILYAVGLKLEVLEWTE